MAQHDGGSVGIDIVPRINASAWGQEIKTRLDPTLNRAGREAGRTYGRALGEGFSARSLAQAVRNSGAVLDPAASRLGRRLGREISRSIKDEIEARLKKLPRVTVAVNVKIDELSLLRAQRRLQRLGPFTVAINVDADTAAALARLEAFRAEAQRTAGRDVNMRVNADTSSAQTNLLALGIQMAALASMPLGSVIAAGVGSIAASAAAAGAGIAGMAAVAVPGVTRIREALQAQKTAQNQVTTATRASASALNTAAIAQAQGQLRAMQMAQAERQVTQAQQAARQAQVALNQARRDAARGLVDMRNQVIDAGLAVRGDQIAVDQARAALDRLNTSRQDALAIQNAQLALVQAQQGFTAVTADPNASQAARDAAKAAVDAAKANLKTAQDQKKAHDEARKEARLAYEQAVQQLREQQVAYKRLVSDERAATKAGVEGSQQVTTAKRALARAVQQVSDAQRAVRTQQIQDRIAALQQADAMRQQAAAGGQVSASSQRLADAMAKLSPAERTLLKDFTAFRDAYRGWVKELEPDVLPVLSQGLGMVRSQFFRAEPLVRSSAAAMRLLEADAKAALAGPFWSQFIANTSVAAPRAILEFGAIAGHTLTGVAGILNAFLPYTTSIGLSVDHLTRKFEAWGTSLGGSAGFIHFMESARQTAPVVVHDLGAMGGAVVSLSRALAPLGQLELQVIGPLADGVAALARTEPGLVQLAAGLYLVSRAGKSLQVAALVRGFVGVGAAATGASTGVGRLGAQLRVLGGAMMGVSGEAVTTRTALLGLSKLGVVIGSLVLAGEAAAAVNRHLDGAKPSADELQKSLMRLGQTGEFSGALLNQFKARVLTANTSLKAFSADAHELADPSFLQLFTHTLNSLVDWVPGVDNQVSKLSERFKGLDTALAQMAQGGHADQASAAFNQLSVQLQHSGLNLNQVNSLFPIYTNLTDTASFRVGNLNQKLAAQNQLMSANAHNFANDQQEVIDFNSAIASGTGLLGSNGQAFFGNTQAARDNRAAVLAAARIVQGYSDDLVANGRVTGDSIRKIRDQRDQLVKLIMKFGVGRDAAQKYADALINIPKAPRTDLSVDAHGRFVMKGVQTKTFMDFINGHAGGGYIGGGGGPRADNHITAVSSGEMVMNARTTARHMPLLAALNDAGNTGTVYKGRGYAGGGLVGGVTTSYVPALAGGGFPFPESLKATYTRRYAMDGDAAKELAAAAKAVGKDMRGMSVYALGQTALISAAIAKLLSGGYGAGAKAVRFEQAQLGEPYVWGATGPDKWDCSALTQAAWRYAGVNIPRVTYDQIASGTPTSQSRAMPGDLYFPEPGHVMMVTGMGGQRALIHAPHTGDVVRYAGWRSGGVYRHISGQNAMAYGGGTPKGFAKAQFGELGWGGDQFSPLNLLWERESNWRWNARNPSSGAYGIPQALPASKMASFGSDYLTNWATQIRWGLDYIKHRYGSPAAAWAHETRAGWYASGTDSARRGIGVVGEQGPELMWFNGGEKVMPYAESMALATAALRAPVALGDAAPPGNETHYHAHMDGWTRASVQHELRSTFHAMSVAQGAEQRIGRRR